MKAKAKLGQGLQTKIKMSSQGNTTIKADFQSSAAADADDPPQVACNFQPIFYLLHTAQYKYIKLYWPLSAAYGG